MHSFEPASDVGDAVAEFPPDSDAGRAPPVGAQVVDRLHLHAEVLGELAGRQHRLEAESGDAFAVHDT